MISKNQQNRQETNLAQKVKTHRSWFKILKRISPLQATDLKCGEFKLYFCLLDIADRSEAVTEEQFHWLPFNLHEVFGASRSNYYKNLSSLRKLGLVSTTQATMLSVGENGVLSAYVGSLDGQVKVQNKGTVSGQEEKIRSKLLESVGGKAEVSTPAGRIDILTESELIEVKHLENWKAALGQVAAYGFFYPNHYRRIHLFGTCPPSLEVELICRRLGVIVTFEKVCDA